MDNAQARAGGIREEVQTSRASRRCHLQQAQARGVGDGFDFVHEKCPLTFENVQRACNSLKTTDEVFDLINQGSELVKIVHSPTGDFPCGLCFWFFLILSRNASKLSRKTAKPLDEASRARLSSSLSS